MRGGVSESGTPTTCEKSSSPHAWGCFQQLVALLFQSSVFPTCVGVFLTPADWAICKRRLPHMRGGVSGRALPDDYDIRSSPHAWGCFQRDIEDISFVMVFPTCVGVFPHKNVTRDRFVRSSPHAWGCFSVFVRVNVPVSVFPTCVGVFLHHV